MGWNTLPDVGFLRVKRVNGAEILDASGRRFLDYCMGFGSLVLGHNPPEIERAISRAALRGGFLHQYETEYTTQLGAELRSLVPCAEESRLFSTGTEATQHAVRVSRRATGRQKIVKFEGHYHGTGEDLIVGLWPEGRGKRRTDGTYPTVPGSGGLAHSAGRSTLVLPYNDAAALEAAFQSHGSEIAAVILEPIALNMGCVFPEQDFLAAVRRITRLHKTILIFDEILTGFRVAPGGAQELLGIVPDLACLGKALGCGMPIAAVTGNAKIMNMMSPPGDVEVGGTNSGRFLGVIGALAGLAAMRRNSFWQRISDRTQDFCSGIREVLDPLGISYNVGGVGGCVGLYFGLESAPKDLRDIATKWNRRLTRRLHSEAFKRGLYSFLVPSRCYPERLTLSYAHESSVLESTLSSFKSAMKAAL